MKTVMGMSSDDGVALIDAREAGRKAAA